MYVKSFKYVAAWPLLLKSELLEVALMVKFALLIVEIFHVLVVVWVVDVAVVVVVVVEVVMEVLVLVGINSSRCH